jgi:DNA relaxase NicK
MGFHAVLGGQAVRQLEQEFNLFSEPAWLSWLALMRARGVRYARIDGAMDDVGPSGVLDMEVIKAAAKSKELVSLFRTCERRNREKWALSGDPAASESGETLYFGARSSNMFVRIYNKGAQLGEAFHHIRVEMEAKERNAEEMVTRVLEHGFNVIPQLLRSYLDFKEPKETKNKSLWATAPWWDRFLSECGKYKLRVPRAAVRTVERVKTWIQRQAAQSMALVFDVIEKQCKASGLDVRKEQRRFINTLVEDGRSRYKSKHFLMRDGFLPSVSLERGLL